LAVERALASMDLQKSNQTLQQPSLSKSTARKIG